MYGILCWIYGNGPDKTVGRTNKRERKLGMRWLAPVYGAWLGVILLNCDYVSEFITLGLWGMLFLSAGYQLLLWFARLWNADNKREKCPYCGRHTLTIS